MANELRRFIEERNGLPMHTGEVRRLNFLVKRIEKAAYRAGLEEAARIVAGVKHYPLRCWTAEQALNQAEVEVRARIGQKSCDHPGCGWDGPKSFVHHPDCSYCKG